MSACCLLLSTVLLATELPSPPEDQDQAAAAATESGAGAGVSPIEIVPRVELREQYLRLVGGAPAHTTTVQVDIQFLRRLLLSYQLPYRIIGTPAGPVAGFGDLQIQAFGVLVSNPRLLVVAIVGAEVDSATRPELGAGKQQIIFGGGAAIKPLRFWVAYGVATEQLALGGDPARPDVNQLEARVGSILFGPQWSWLKLDLDTIGDFAGDTGRLFGTVELGSLLIGRVGLFARAGGQLAGPRQIDYSLTVGARYLFRLERGRPRP